MSNQLDELRKWSESVARSTWNGFNDMMKVFGLPKPSGANERPGDFTERILRINQLTLTMLEQYRSWEGLNEKIKQFSEGLLAGLKTDSDERSNSLETEITELKTRLNEQEKMLKDLQSKLQSSTDGSDEPDRTKRILTDFFSEQTRQFKKLIRTDD